MRNIIRILAPEELKPLLDSICKKYSAEPEYFSEKDGLIIRKISYTQPDAVILNLFMKDEDAVELIRAYRLLYLNSFTYFAVICPFDSETIRSELKDCGVNMIIQRTCEKRDISALMAEVSQMMNTPLATLKCNVINTVHKIHHRQNKSAPENSSRFYTVHERTREILEALGFDNKDAGDLFLRRAIELAVTGNGADCSVTKEIYPVLAAEFGTTPSCVERRIRGAIIRAWNSENSSIIAAYFGYTVDNMRGRPTNSEFIALLADHIRMED